MLIRPRAFIQPAIRAAEKAEARGDHRMAKHLVGLAEDMLALEHELIATEGTQAEASSAETAA